MLLRSKDRIPFVSSHLVVVVDFSRSRRLHGERLRRWRTAGPPQSHVWLFRPERMVPEPAPVLDRVRWLPGQWFRHGFWRRLWVLKTNVHPSNVLFTDDDTAPRPFYFFLISQTVSSSRIYLDNFWFFSLETREGKENQFALSLDMFTVGVASSPCCVPPPLIPLIVIYYDGAKKSG